jgi:hypothetical protein
MESFLEWGPGAKPQKKIKWFWFVLGFEGVTAFPATSTLPRVS